MRTASAKSLNMKKRISNFLEFTNKFAIRK